MNDAHEVLYVNPNEVMGIICSEVLASLMSKGENKLNAMVHEYFSL